MLLMILVAVIPTIAVASIVLQGYKSRAISDETGEVREKCEQLAEQFVYSGYLSDTENDLINGQISMLASVYDCRLIIIDGNSRVIKDTYELETGRYLRTDETRAAIGGEELTVYDDPSKEVFLTVPVKDQDNKIIGAMLATLSVSTISSHVRNMYLSAGITLAVSLVLIVLAGVFLSKWLVAPFKRLTSSINSVYESDPIKTISVNDCTETKQISDAFNRLIKEINMLNESRNDFVANVSHELKTPMTSMKILADSLTMNPNTSVDEYREFMLDISSEVDRESKIISELLSLVSLDSKSEELKFVNTDINELVGIVVNRLRPIAEENGVELSYESFKPVSADVDQDKFIIIVTNLVENAIKYNKAENGWVRVSLNADPNFMYLSVADSGIGIPEEEYNNIFDRFYRVDKSRSKEIGGNGLGLSITKSAIQQHQGAITVDSVPGEGTTFTVRIPLVHLA